MDTSDLRKMIKDIKVKNLENQDVEVNNKSPLQMIGKGRQGAVFHYTDDICVKVFGNEEDCKREYEALSMGQHTGLFPMIYDYGPLFIVMETIKGIDLREYLQSHPLTEEISAMLIHMLVLFKEIGFERIDHHKRQIYLQEDGTLRVIDVSRAIWRDRVYPYPRKLLNSLGEDHKAIFLQHVQNLAPNLYEEWAYYIRMEELAREIYWLSIEDRSNSEIVEELSTKLLTTQDEKKHIHQLTNLMHKVFKEEWVKTMLAKGHNPDEVMEKINEHWDALEQKQLEEKDDLSDLTNLIQKHSKSKTNKRTTVKKPTNTVKKPTNTVRGQKKVKEGNRAEFSKRVRKELADILKQTIMENSKNLKN